MRVAVAFDHAGDPLKDELGDCLCEQGRAGRGAKRNLEQAGAPEGGVT